MTIEEALSAIKNAVYGKDVRQAMHDGILQAEGGAGTVAKKAEASAKDSAESAKKAAESSKKSEIASKAIEGKADQAVTIAKSANSKSDSTRLQLDEIVINGDSSVEAAQARVDIENFSHDTLKARLDKEQREVNAQLAEKTNEIFNGQLSNKMTAKPSLTIIDDDGRPNVYTLLKQLAQEYDIPITSGVITGRIGDDAMHISKEQMKELSKIGFEFVSHTKTHPHLATLTEAEIEDELKGSSDWLNENGFDGHSTIVYPYGSYNDSVQRIARKYYKSGFDIPLNGGSYVTPILKQFAIQRVAYNFENGTYDTENIKAKIDESIANNGWTIAMTHAGYINFTIEGLREIVEYAKSKGVDIITVKEGLNRFGNLIDVSGSWGSASVGADGQLSAGFRSAVDGSHIKPGTPITDYPEGLSLTYLNNAHAALRDFPLGQGGSLETYRPNSNFSYAYQKYITYAAKDVYFRSWNTTRGEWEAWEKQSNAHIKSATASTAFTEFKLGITTSYVNTDNASGLPESAAGTIVTYKPSTLPAACYQTFKRYNSNDTYIRHLNSSGNWSGWINTSRPHEDVGSVNTENGWTTTVNYSKTQDGQVWLRGILRAGTVTTGTVIATLPTGYSGGNFYPYFSVHNHTQNRAITDAIQIFGRDLVLKSSEIVTGDSIRFSTYFQTTEN